MLRIIVICFIAVLISNCLFYAEGATANAAAADKPAIIAKSTLAVKTVSIHYFRGLAVSIDVPAGKLVGKDKKGKTKDFTVGAKAKITKAKSAVMLNGIVAGDHVEIGYKEKDGVNEVKFIEVLPSAKLAVPATKK